VGGEEVDACEKVGNVDVDGDCPIGDPVAGFEVELGGEL